MQYRVIALTLAIVLTAREAAAGNGASMSIEPPASQHPRAGWALTGVGAFGLALAIAGGAVIGSSRTFGDVLENLAIGGPMIGVGGVVACTALPVGVTLLVEGPRTERRVRLGRRLTLAGGISALVAVGFLVAFLVEDHNGQVKPDWFYPTVNTLGIATGAVGLALVSSGVTLWRF